MVNAEDLRGRIAPSFELIDHEGRPFKFVPGTLGARLVIFFFVGPGATITTYQVARMMQLYDSKLRGSQNQADESRLQVVGVCTAKGELLAHQARARGLRYPLISDPDAAVARSFGVGSMVDKWFTKRASFVIDEDGKVEDLCISELAFFKGHDEIDRHIRLIEHTLKRMDLKAAERKGRVHDTEDAPAQHASVPKIGQKSNGLPGAHTEGSQGLP